MTKQLLRRHVQGSTLIDDYGKFETVAALLEQQPRSLKLDTLFSTRNSGWTNTTAFHAARSQGANPGPYPVPEWRQLWWLHQY